MTLCNFPFSHCLSVMNLSARCRDIIMRMDSHGPIDKRFNIHLMLNDPFNYYERFQLLKHIIF